MISILEDKVLDPIDPKNSVEELSRVLSLLCGQKVGEDLSAEARQTIEQFLTRVKSDDNEVNLSFEEFNELLLLFNQYRVSRPFFSFFFLDEDPRKDDCKASLPFADLKKGISKFRGFALLCYGSFRFAYRALSEEHNAVDFVKILSPWNRDSEKAKLRFENRQQPLASLQANGDEISKADTWLCGYLSGSQLDSDKSTLDAMSDRDNEIGTSISSEEALKASNTLKDLRRQQETARAKGKRNTVKYLTWDFMDVYVATSMRHRWEYEETAAFIGQVFGQELRDLRGVRWFDPTQSFSDVTIDKGLVESLMLKRAQCTIYMAQESDTLGKDSELAATLAQGKPVIAYVPRWDENECVKSMEQRPLRYISQRLLSLWADSFFDKADVKKNICDRAKKLGIDIQPDTLVDETRDALSRLLAIRPRFQVISTAEEDSFIKDNGEWVTRVKQLMSCIECEATETRAQTLKLKHPLNMQVHLQKGVANGVLVARSAKECATLLRGVLLRNLKFRIRPLESNGVSVATVLEEAVSDDALRGELGSRFRVVTEDKCLTNSFWNFYLEEEVNIDD